MDFFDKTLLFLGLKKVIKEFEKEDNPIVNEDDTTGLEEYESIRRNERQIEILKKQIDNEKEKHQLELQQSEIDDKFYLNWRIRDLSCRRKWSTWMM